MVVDKEYCGRLRSWAWRGLWERCWFWKLFATGLMFGFISQMAQSVLNTAFVVLGGVAHMEYIHDVMAALSAGSAPPALPQEIVPEIVTAGLITAFVSVILSGIASFGMAAVSLKCARGEDSDWLASAFGGFRRPLSLAWLFVRLLLIYTVWSIAASLVAFAIVLGLARSTGAAGSMMGIAVFSAAVPCAMLVPFYRYRFAYLVQADNPDFSAGETLRRTKELMDGNMWKSFSVDCSYWFAFLLPLLLTLAGVLCILVGRNGLGLLAFLFLVPVLWVLFMYVKMGQVGLYLALTGGRREDAQNEVVNE